MNGEPKRVRNDWNPHSRQDNLRNDDAGKDNVRHRNEEQRVPQMIETNGPWHFLKYPKSSVDNPAPAHQKVRDNHWDKNKADPFMKRESGRLGSGGGRKQEEDKKIDIQFFLVLAHCTFFRAVRG